MPYLFLVVALLSGGFKGSSWLFLDPNVPPEFQQTSTKGHGKGIRRGYLIPAKILDY